MENTLAGSITPGELAQKPVTCKLTTPELQERKKVVVAELKKQVIERKEVPDGFTYRFHGTDEMLDTITSFIKTERLCCDFFNFKIAVSHDSFILLEISGPGGAKEFITTELEM